MSSQTPQSNSIPEEWLSAYLDDELDTEQRRLVESAVSQNPQLAQLLQDLRATRSLIQQLPSFPNTALMRSRDSGQGTNSDLDDGLNESVSSANQKTFNLASGSDSGIESSEKRLRSDRSESNDSDHDTGIFRIGFGELSQWRTMALAATVIAVAVVGSLAWYGVFGGSSGSVALAPAAPPSTMPDRGNLVDNEAGPSGSDNLRSLPPAGSFGGGLASGNGLPAADVAPALSQSAPTGAAASNEVAQVPSSSDRILAGGGREQPSDRSGGLREDAVPTLKDAPDILKLPASDMFAAQPEQSNASDKSIPPKQFEFPTTDPTLSNALAINPPNVAQNSPGGSSPAGSSAAGNSTMPPNQVMESRGGELQPPPAAADPSQLSLSADSKSPPAPSMGAPKRIESFADQAQPAQKSDSSPNPRYGSEAGNPRGLLSPESGSGSGGRMGGMGGGMGGMAGGMGGARGGGMGGGGFGAPGATPLVAPESDSLKMKSSPELEEQSRSKNVAEAKKSIELKSTFATKAAVYRSNAWTEEEMLTQLEANALLRQIKSLRVKANNEPQLSKVPAKASPITIAVVSLEADQRQILLQLVQQALPNSKLQDDNETLNMFFLSKKELDQLQQSFTSNSNESIKFTISSSTEPASDRCVLIVNPK